jgi:hypothetical protein
VEGAGERFFDDSIRGGNGIRNRFLLVVADSATSNVQDAAKLLSANFPDVVELRTERREGITLVRPDGYIAYSDSNSNHLAGLESLRELLLRQTSPDTASS